MLTTTDLKKVASFDPDLANRLNTAVGGCETLSAAGALSLNCYESKLTVSGTMAFTLAAPTVEGQRKKIMCRSAASIPLATLTISSPDDTTGFVCGSTFVFDTPGQAIELVATSSLKWRPVRVQRAGSSGANGVVVGTTTLTGKALWQNYCLSVTGTVSSTTTKALPNGSAVGERIVVNVTTAASIPSGSIAGSFRTIAGATGTTLGGLDNTADTALLEWDGQYWQVLYSTGVSIS